MFVANIKYDRNDVNIEFPCDERHLVSKLNEIDVPAVKNPQQFLNDINYNGLKCLTPNFINIDELNYLAKRMKSFDTREKTTFIAVVADKGIATLKDMINLTFNLDKYMIVQDLSSMEKVGRLYVLTANGGVSKDKIQKYDFAKIGKDLMESGKGKPTQYGLLFENDEVELTGTYNGKVFPGYCYEYKLVETEIEYNGMSEYVYLPDIPVVIDKALKRLEATLLEKCQIKFYDLHLDRNEWVDMLYEIETNEDVYAANAVLEQDDILKKTGKLDKLMPVMDFAEATDSKPIIQLAQNIDEFEFYEDVTDIEELGKKMIEQEDDYHIHDDIKEYFMFEQYAEDRLQEYDSKFTEYGAVLLQGKTLDEILSQEEKNLGMTMGGM